MTVNKLLKEASEEIGYNEAKILIEYVLKIDRNHLIFSLNTNLNKRQENEYRRSINEIKNGMPIQYITGKASFFGLKFLVNKNVLIPQPDTEILVEETLKQIEKKNKIKGKNKIKILDLCTGSGAVALSIAKYAQNVEIFASDISKRALNVAKRNYEELINNSDENKVTFINSDMFKNINGQFDIIVSNPPYIRTDVIDTLDKEVRNEPKLALDGGKDGLKFYKTIKKNANKYLKKDGVLLMEIGFDQKEAVQKIFENSVCIKDFAGNDRVIITESV